MLRLRTARRRGVAFFAALALLCAQAIGLAHAVAHPQGQGAAASPHAGGAAQQPGHGVFDAQHDAGSSQCRLLDQLGHADVLLAPPVAWTFAAPEAAFAPVPVAVAHATCARGYHARGPPPVLA